MQTAGPALERKGDIAALLSALEPRAVFFVDEVHRLNRALEETFYPAMEDRRLPITIGQGAGARVVTLDLPPFTLIGATTRAGLLTTPLRDRFGIQHRFEPYGVEDLARIVRRSATILDVALDEGGAWAIAARSRGTPRVANRLLKRVRDWAEVRGSGVVDDAAADAALAMLEVDELGLDRLDREILTTICAQFAGGPVGLSTLAIAVNEEADTLEDVYEPYLLQRGLIQRTPRGRAATRRAYEHLGLEPPRESRAVLGAGPLAERQELAALGRQLEAGGARGQRHDLAVGGQARARAQADVEAHDARAEGARAGEGAVEELLAVALDAQEGRRLALRRTVTRRLAAAARLGLGAAAPWRAFARARRWRTRFARRRADARGRRRWRPSRSSGPCRPGGRRGGRRRSPA